MLDALPRPSPKRSRRVGSVSSDVVAAQLPCCAVLCSAVHRFVMVLPTPPMMHAHACLPLPTPPPAQQEMYAASLDEAPFRVLL